ncbi:hypothetical protein HYALB_00005140, partial [Hymenoscyphus albidus]
MPSQSNTRGSKPKNWPPEIPFLTAPIYSKTFQQHHITSLKTKNTTDPTIPTISTAKGPCSLVKITPISTPSHPAHGQSGLFATADLKPGTFILQYMGEIHVTLTPISNSLPESSSNSNSGLDQTHDPACKSINIETIDPHANSNYDLSLDREWGIGIDAKKCGTEARFINDYRGVAAAPNAEFREIWDGNRKERGMG